MEGLLLREYVIALVSLLQNLQGALSMKARWMHNPGPHVLKYSFWVTKHFHFFHLQKAVRNTLTLVYLLLIPAIRLPACLNQWIGKRLHQLIVPVGHLLNQYFAVDE